MREEILEAVREMIQAIIGGNVVIGSIPPVGGYSIVAAPGSGPISTFMGLTTNEGLTVQFMGKGPDQFGIATAMDAAHKALTTSKVLPYADTWQIYAITTTSAPALIGREQNVNWIYGSSLRVKFYAR